MDNHNAKIVSPGVYIREMYTYYPPLTKELIEAFNLMGEKYGVSINSFHNNEQESLRDLKIKMILENENKNEHEHE